MDSNDECPESPRLREIRVNSFFNLWGWPPTPNMRGYLYHSFISKTLKINFQSFLRKLITKIVSDCPTLQEIGINFWQFSWGWLPNPPVWENIPIIPCWECHENDLRMPYIAGNRGKFLIFFVGMTPKPLQWERLPLPYPTHRWLCRLHPLLTY